MRLRKPLLLALCLAVVPAAVYGTGSLSAMSTDRTVDVAVVGDDRAYLGIETETGQGYVGGDAFTVLWLTDRFSEDVALVSVSTGSSLVETETSTPVDIGGESEPLPVRARCGQAGSETVAFTVVAESPSARAVVTRAASVTCREPEVRRVEFQGCGNARIEADDAIYPLSVTKVVDNPSTNRTTTDGVTIHSDGNVGAGQGGKLVAVEADGERYENPNTCTGEGQASVETDGAGPAGTDAAQPPTTRGNRSTESG